jgi:hypothetical protein
MILLGCEVVVLVGTTTRFLTTMSRFLEYRDLQQGSGSERPIISPAAPEPRCCGLIEQVVSWIQIDFQMPSVKKHLR